MAVSKAPSFFSQLRQASKKWNFDKSGYNKYGMLHDDLLHETPVVEEAIRRLPQEVKDVRTYRILRAIQCSIRHEYLPKELWTKYEEDVRYVQPYLDEVLREEAERHEWDSK